MCSKQLPADAVLVGDSFFGSHATAQRPAREGCPFITMVRNNTAGVLQAGDRIQAGQTAVATVDGHKYALQVYKQPKAGGKPPKLRRSCPTCGTLRGTPCTTLAGKTTPSLLRTAKWHGGWTLPTRWRCICASWEGSVLVASRARLLAAIRRGQRVCNLPRPRKVPWHG